MATAADQKEKPTLRLVYSAPAKKKKTLQHHVSAKDLILCSRRLTSTAKALVKSSRERVRDTRTLCESWRENPGRA
jgi:hypothetical protein